jgi:subtilisin family serine protease
VAGSPVYATPVYATPVYATPVYATPVYATPVYATEYRATGKRKSSARPAATAPPVPDVSAYAEGGPHVVVLDTGLASANLRPAFLRGVQCPDKECEEPDEDHDHDLDPAAGHGTFIAGLIRLLAPGCRVSVRQVLSTYGDGDEVAIARTIASLDDDVDILNLSFGGYTPERMHALAAAVRLVQRRGVVVVASAGNDGTCRPAYPAALPNVVGVGALGPDGPARFSNYGDWVRACAPGVDIVSAFFSRFDGPQAAPTGGVDPDRFRDWATWSGSSFSAPIVAAAIAREMHVSSCKAPDAVTRVVDGPGLFRIPDMGTVVNLQ